jgi:5-methylcytosine-specific restriction enzyme A
VEPRGSVPVRQPPARSEPGTAEGGCGVSLQTRAPLKSKCSCGVKAYPSEAAAGRALERIKGRRLRTVMPKRVVQCWLGQWHLEGTKRIETGPDKLTRQVVLERDSWSCVCCGDPIDLPRGYSLQHRLARGGGGTSDPEINSPANLITLCGSATSPDGCHFLAESRSDATRSAGYWLKHGKPGEHEDPATIPVFHAAFGSYVLLGVDGTATPIPGGAA